MITDETGRRWIPLHIFNPEKTMNYQQAALKTCPDGYHPSVPAGLLMRVMMDYVNASNALDALKKSYAYGRDLPAGLKPIADANADVQFKGEIDGDVLHAVLGVATEGGELVEAAMKSLFNGEQFDIVNFQEEMGDVAWYRAIGLAAVGQSIAENDTQNIEKLAKRFNDGRFDADLANNRDTDAERVVLEGHAPDGDHDPAGVILPDPDPDFQRVKAANQRVLNCPLFTDPDRIERDRETVRVDQEIRIIEPVIFNYGPDHDRIRGKSVMGDSMITGKIDLHPFVAGDEYDGKYAGMLLATDEVHIYRLVGAVHDERSA